jgi:hypothetical protein
LSTSPKPRRRKSSRSKSRGRGPQEIGDSNSHPESVRSRNRVAESFSFLYSTVLNWISSISREIWICRSDVAHSSIFLIMCVLPPQWVTTCKHLLGGGHLSPNHAFFLKQFWIFATCVFYTALLPSAGFDPWILLYESVSPRRKAVRTALQILTAMALGLLFAAVDAVLLSDNWDCKTNFLGTCSLLVPRCVCWPLLYWPLCLSLPGPHVISPPHPSRLAPLCSSGIPNRRNPVRPRGGHPQRGSPLRHPLHRRRPRHGHPRRANAAPPHRRRLGGVGAEVGRVGAVVGGRGYRGGARGGGTQPAKAPRLRVLPRPAETQRSPLTG